VNLRGKVLVVTGAGRGIGRAHALYAASEGARVVVNDLGCDRDGNGSDPSIADGVVAEIRRAGGEAVASHHDVSDERTASALVALARERFGRIDAAIASAGISRERTVLNTELDDLDAVLGVHLRGSFALTRAVARALIDQGEGGSIVLTTGPAAFFGVAQKATGSAAGAAIAALVRAAAVELRKHDIRVNALAPTARTRATEHLPTFQGIREGSMSPEHVAPVAAFLISDLAADVSGEILGVAGGRVYALRSKETTGAFTESRPFTLEEIKAAFPEITRS
jgi:NAD(P)-dependent dehydrogenase (short-subunit alcohol dehydrogenase family)